MKKVTTHQAKTHLSRLLAEVEAGEEVVICRGATPAARLVPISRPVRPRRPRIGTKTSATVRIAKDAFAPLDSKDLEQWGL